MNDIFKIEQTLNKVGRFFLDALRAELINQGHEVTGRLIRELRYKIEKSANEVTLNIYMDKYGIYVNNGVLGAKIPYNRGSGAKKSMYIDALIGWIEQKGLESGDRDIKNFAFAIANKHKKEGMPTGSSSRFSRNGRRTGFIDSVIRENNQEVETLIETEAGEAVEVFFDNLVRNANKK
jgi:hypothetical protein